MADFRAKIIGEIDLSKAQSALNGFCNQRRQLNIDVNLVNNGQIISQLSSIGQQAGSKFAASFNSSLGHINTTQAMQQLQGLRDALGKKFNFNTSAIDNITKNIGNMDVAVQSIQTKMRSKGGLDVTVKGVDQMGRAVTITKQFDKAGKQLQSTLNTVATAEKAVSSAQLTISGNNLTTWANNNSKAVKAYGDRIKELQDRMRDMQTKGASTSQFKQWADDVKILQSEARATGNIGKTLGEQFAQSFGSVTKFAMSYLSIYQVFNTIRDGIQTVRDLDDALVDLQKTTTATPAQLNEFYNNANQIAKEYGVTTQQIIQGAADWSRLGYNLQDSQTMSKLSSQFSSISPGMDVETSTSSLVATMKAFGIEADDVLDGIMSKVNIVGNNFALSNLDVMTALKNSSASMAAANNTFEETVALITAGQEIAQDSSKVGNALRTGFCAYVQKCA